MGSTSAEMSAAEAAPSAAKVSAAEAAASNATTVFSREEGDDEKPDNYSNAEAYGSPKVIAFLTGRRQSDGRSKLQIHIVFLRDFLRKKCVRIKNRLAAFLW